MMKLLSKILSKIMIATTAIVLVMPCAVAESNLIGMGDIGEYGSWATDHNLEVFKSDLNNDIDKFQASFQQHQAVENYVPMEVKVGLAFMNALSWIGKVLDNSLIRFINIFLIIGYVFWIMLEAYNMMTKDNDVPKLVEAIIKKGVILSIWMLVLSYGVAEIFMVVISPIIAVGVYLADLILNTVTNMWGASLPDTCGQIHQYVAAHISRDAMVDANATANILCLPTRLSGFFYTGVAVGWKWMLAGIGHSAFAFLIGAVFVVMFVWNIWKFALMALGVIANIFLALLLLPFAAINSTLSQTSYKGVVGNIYNAFIGMFNTQALSLKNQVAQFLNTALYFISLSIVIALCGALMAGTMGPDLAQQIPSMDNHNFMVIILTLLLVWYLADKADKIAKDFGGKIDDGANAITSQIKGDISKLWSGAYSFSKRAVGVIRRGGSST